MVRIHKMNECKIDFSYGVILNDKHNHNMTIARQIKTRSISKSQTLHTMTTRSGMTYKPSIIKKTKHVIIKVKESATPQGQPCTPQQPIPLQQKQYTRPVLAEFVPLAYRAIIEVLDIYRNNPNEQSLVWLEEAIGLTGQLHRASLSSAEYYNA